MAISYAHTIRRIMSMRENALDVAVSPLFLVIKIMLMNIAKQADSVGQEYTFHPSKQNKKVSCMAKNFRVGKC